MPVLDLRTGGGTGLGDETLLAPPGVELTTVVAAVVFDIRVAVDAKEDDAGFGSVVGVEVVETETEECAARSE